MDDRRPSDIVSVTDSLTWCAPAERATHEEFQALVAHVAQSALVTAMLRSIGGIAMVLNRRRQIVAVNKPLLRFLNCRDAEAVLGMRPGEAAQCVHARDNVEGGRHPSSFCASCGAVIAIVASQETRVAQRNTCTLTTKTDGLEKSLDLSVQAGTLTLGDHDLTFVSFQNPGEEKAVGASGRSFFHDLVTTASALAKVTHLTTDGIDPVAFDNAMLALAERLELELLEQNDMAALAQSRAVLRTRDVSADEICKGLVHAAASAATQGKILDISPASPHAFLESDPALLLRSLQNAITRALQGAAEGGTVRVWCEEDIDHVTFHVSRAAIMPVKAAVDVFERYLAASIQNGWQPMPHGRELIAEEHLGGRVTVHVTAWEGADIAFEFPRHLGQCPSPADGLDE
ncbi:hypothetical protein HQ560_17275 [bacterium]|nr:hypothetical protein [bacterium]